MSDLIIVLLVVAIFQCAGLAVAFHLIWRILVREGQRLDAELKERGDV